MNYNVIFAFYLSVAERCLRTITAFRNWQIANVHAWCQIPEYNFVCDNADGSGTQDASRAYSTEDYLKITEDQLKASAAQQQGQTPPPKEGETEPQIQPPG